MQEKRSVLCSAFFTVLSPAAVAKPLLRGLGFLLSLTSLLLVESAFAANLSDASLRIPQSGDQALHILTPNQLELFLVSTKQAAPARVDIWDWVDDQQNFIGTNLSRIRVLINGESNPIIRTGFKRRPLYAPLLTWDLRIGNELYLQLRNWIPEGASVQVLNDGTLWPTNMAFEAVADPQRNSPAIHVNQEGYLPAYPKKAAVGYYLGDLGEMAILTNKFYLVDARSGAKVYEGSLAPRKDVGYMYTPTPYQNVYEADFTSFASPGAYKLVVPGMGASLSFQVDEGIAMDFART
jgi:hypothetical protein